jgi:drug/metabolite transporter (DMT)-like permease
MSIDPLFLFISLFPSGVGFVLFVYGKKRDRWPQLVAGLVLIVYPYFTETVGALVGVGLAVGGALWLALRLGW